MTRSKNITIPQTTAQSLSSLVKSCRNIMRKDKGLSTDIDRLPMLTWIMFLKFLDDLEQLRETEAKLADKRFKSVIESPYRWRDWAIKPDGITGDALIAFINNDEVTRPDGTRGAGLFAYLRSLQGSNGGDRRDVVSAIFQGTVNRMINGYLLRDVLNKITTINFTSTEDIYTLSHLYESMLKEMRDAAGENGEFYTPRPVIDFIVTVMNPQLGEIILDPACGTGGFLASAFEHLKKQCKTAEDNYLLQRETLFGIEAKPLPYLLCQMNLLLHGIEYPRIDPLNALRFPLREIGEKDRVDIILTNPPFGGEEEKGIQGNFPEDKKTSETALLFLQLIMRKLRKKAHGHFLPPRAAVIVPNGTLYQTGIAARIRADLITNFNLHTVVRLPKGIFEPYADIPTNILFFDVSRTTDVMHFYQHPLPPKRAILRSPSYSLSEPLQYEELTPIINWWKKRDQDVHSWTITAAELARQDYNLDQKNPNQFKRPVISLASESGELTDSTRRLSAAVDEQIISLKHTAKLLAQVKSAKCTTKGLGEVCRIVKGNTPTMKAEPGPYTFVVTAAQLRSTNKFQFDTEAVCVPMISSTGHGHASIHRIHYVSGKFALANIMAALLVKDDIPLRTKYLYYYLCKHKEDKLVSLMAGTANTSFTLTDLQNVEIIYPTLAIQDAIVAALNHLFDIGSRVQMYTNSISEKHNNVKSGLIEALSIN